MLKERYVLPRDSECKLFRTSVLIVIKSEVIAKVIKPNTNLFLKITCSFESEVTQYYNQS